jgi:hypothetical protein
MLATPKIAAAAAVPRHLAKRQEGGVGEQRIKHMVILRIVGRHQLAKRRAGIVHIGHDLVDPETFIQAMRRNTVAVASTRVIGAMDRMPPAVTGAC